MLVDDVADDGGLSSFPARAFPLLPPPPPPPPPLLLPLPPHSPPPPPPPSPPLAHAAGELGSRATLFLAGKIISRLPSWLGMLTVRACTRGSISFAGASAPW